MKASQVFALLTNWLDEERQLYVTCMYLLQRLVDTTVVAALLVRFPFAVR